MKNTKNEALISFMESENYAEAKPLAIELFSSMDDDSNDEDPLYWVVLMIRGESDSEVTKDEFLLSKSMFDLANSMPATKASKSIIKTALQYCERYENELSQKENVELREMAFENAGKASKQHHLVEMIIYLINSKQTESVIIKADELAQFNKSDSFLFRSYIFRHGLGMPKSMNQALYWEVESVKAFKNDNLNCDYGYFYNLLDDVEPLFEYDFESKKFSMDKNIFTQYTLNIENYSIVDGVMASIRALELE